MYSPDLFRSAMDTKTKGPEGEGKEPEGEAVEFKLETAPFDPRFPNQNQTQYCYQSFIDYHRCRKVKGEDYKPCDYFLRVYRAICPISWVERWNEQIAEGSFPGRI